MDERKLVVLFYVQHLLGMGHVFRATRVARALARAGCRVHLVWGGMKVEKMDLTGLEVTWLKGVRVEGENFKTLLLEDGTPISDMEKDARKDVLLQLFEKTRPDIVITEAYPFGRRQMRFELLPLMEACKQASWSPLVVSSIRDIMQENRVEKRVRESLDLVQTYFDHVMVHGDPNLIPIEATLQGVEEIKDRIFYTGLVAPEPISGSNNAHSPDVLISAGGGVVGRNLMFSAVEAMQYSKELPKNWLLTTGPDLAPADFSALLAKKPVGMEIVRFIPKLAEVMAACKVSVSLAGYNTVGDVLRAGVRAVLVPFEGGLETEQLRRAERLAEIGRVSMVRDADLTPQSLAKAIGQASRIDVSHVPVDMEGADNAARLLIEKFNSHQAAQ